LLRALPATIVTAAFLAIASPAAAQSLQFPGAGTEWIPIPLGEPYPFPRVTYSDYGSTDSAPRTVDVEVMGGCGTFEGSARIAVTVTRQGGIGEWSAALPPFVASKSGPCSVRASRGQPGQAGYTSREAYLVVYDPMTLRVRSRFEGVVAGAGGELLDGANPYVADAQGFIAPGQEVRLESPDRCVTVNGQAYQHVAPSSADGQARFVVLANGPPRRCRLVATLVRTGQSTTIDVVIYDPHRHASRVRRSPPSPTSSSSSGRPFPTAWATRCRACASMPR
jgi:hypothetical protein